MSFGGFIDFFQKGKVSAKSIELQCYIVIIEYYYLIVQLINFKHIF